MLDQRRTATLFALDQGLRRSRLAQNAGRLNFLLRDLKDSKTDHFGRDLGAPPAATAIDGHREGASTTSRAASISTTSCSRTARRNPEAVKQLERI